MGLQELDLSGFETQRRAAAPFRAALADLCFDRGFVALTIDDVCRHAGLSRSLFRTFYQNLEDCLFDACAAELWRYGKVVDEAVAGVAGWRNRLRAAAYALYRRLDGDERLRWLTLVEARAAGGATAMLIDEAVQPLYDLVDEGRADPAAPPTLTRATAELLGGVIFNEVYLASLRRGPLPREREIVPKLMFLTVLPYLGEIVATEELLIPPPGP